MTEINKIFNFNNRNSLYKYDFVLIFFLYKILRDFYLYYYYCDANIVVVHNVFVAINLKLEYIKISTHTNLLIITWLNSILPFYKLKSN